MSDPKSTEDHDNDEPERVIIDKPSQAEGDEGDSDAG
jgi:hypothetical protein